MPKLRVRDTRILIMPLMFLHSNFIFVSSTSHNSRGRDDISSRENGAKFQKVICPPPSSQKMNLQGPTMALKAPKSLILQLIHLVGPRNPSWRMNIQWMAVMPVLPTQPRLRQGSRMEIRRRTRRRTQPSCRCFRPSRARRGPERAHRLRRATRPRSGDGC